MTIRSVFNPNVATIDGHADVAQAAVLMRQEHVGDLIVTEQRDGHSVPVGVVTDRDIVVEVVARHADPVAITVGEMITRDVLTVREDNGIDYALRKMRDGGVRRAPVVDGSGALVGVVSVDDVIEHIARQLGDIASVTRLQQAMESEQLP